MVLVGSEEMDASDGYHTFSELYQHRIALFIALCNAISGLSVLSRTQGKDKTVFIPVWRSKKHSDGELAFGGTWFVLGMFTEKGKQITYHLPIESWNQTNFAETLEIAPEWDGHTPVDVLERLKNL